MARLTPDPKKRSFLLPPGCKDLIDLLRPGKAAARDALKLSSATDRPPMERESWAARGRLSEMERFVTMLAESHHLFSSLWLNPLAQELSVDLCRAQGCPIRASLTVQMGTDLETEVRAFWARRGLERPVDSALPPQFHPDLAVRQRYDLSPLPLDVAGIASTLKAVLHEVARLEEDAEIHFRYRGCSPKA